MAKKPQFGVVPDDVFDDPRIDAPYPKLIFAAIQRHVQGMEGDAWPSHERIAAMCSISRDSVKRHVKILVDLGYVTKINRPGTSNLYKVALSAPGADSPTRVVQRAPGGGAESTTNKNQGTRTNEEDSSSSVSSHSSVSTRDEIQTESAQALLERELGATLIDESASIAECGRFGCTLPAGHNQGQADIPENHQVAVTNGDHPVGMSRLTESKAREKFDPDKYDPDKAAVEQAALTKSIGQSVNAEKMSALAKARTSRPIKFPDGFHPSLVGYTEQMFKAEFSLLNYPDTLNGFIAHHMSKGDTSENWLGSFLTYAQRGQRMAVEQRSQNGDHEPAVNRAATWDAKRKQMFREQANEGEGYAAWQARMEREGVTLP